MAQGGSMNTEQLERMKSGTGFIAALDQSGGSTPKALALYGVEADRYATDAEMFDLVHAMRERIVTSPAFTGAHILGAILFEQTMSRDFQGKPAPDYLWENKNVVPFVKVDLGLESEESGVQLMKPIPALDDLLDRASAARVFGTKMRSVINSANPIGIAEVVAQQFEIARQIVAAGLVPIIEPEVTITAPDKVECERFVLDEITDQLEKCPFNGPVMFKLSIPTINNFYQPLMDNPAVLRVVALSGGYSREEANERLALNHGLIGSFSRALSEGLTDAQNDDEFNATLAESIQSIYRASLT